LEDAKTDLAGVRDALRALIGPDTILIGHSLDSDLKMMRLVHYNVIDTAIVSVRVLLLRFILKPMTVIPSPTWRAL